MSSYNAIFIAFGNFFRQGCFFIAQIVIANSIGIGSFGLYSTLFSIMLVWEAFGSFGTRMSLWKHIAKKKFLPQDNIIFYVAVRAIIALACIFVSLIVLLVIDVDEIKYLFYFLIIILINQSTFDWIFLSRSETKKVVIYNISAGIIYVAILSLYFAIDDSIIFLPLIFSVSFLIPGIYLIKNDIARLKDLKISSLFRFQKTIIRFSINFFGYDLIQRIYLALPLVLTYFLTTPSLAGEFRLVSLIIMLAVTLSTSLAFGFFNKIVINNHNERGNSIAKALILTTILIVPIAFYAGDVLSLNFIKNYIPNVIEVANILYAANILIFIALSNILRELFIPLGRILISSISFGIFFISFSVLIFHYEINSIKTLINFLVISEILSLIFLTFFLFELSILKNILAICYKQSFVIFFVFLICLIAIKFNLGIYSTIFALLHLILVYKYITKLRPND